MRDQLLSRFRRARKKALRTERSWTRAVARIRRLARQQWRRDRRGDRKIDLRSRARPLRQAWKDLPGDLSRAAWPGARPAPRRLHPARNTREDRRGAK